MARSPAIRAGLGQRAARRSWTVADEHIRDEDRAALETAGMKVIVA